jgi:four helix bundle protein
MPKSQFPISNDDGAAGGVTRKCDLKERTTQFAAAVIRFARSLRQDVVTTPLISQFVDAGTSVGSNYREADNAESRKDLHHKIGICRKEADETRYWIEMIVTAQPSAREGAKPLWQEAKELHLIFCDIFNKTQ